MQRVKNVDYDDDDLFDDEDEFEQEDGTYSAEDKDNFAILTPVIRAELEEAGVQASDKDIEDALWHYYWDVGKSVSYLKTSKTPKPQQQSIEKAKPKSKFDEAAERSAEKAGESNLLFDFPDPYAVAMANAALVSTCTRRGGRFSCATSPNER